MQNPTESRLSKIGKKVMLFPIANCSYDVLKTRHDSNFDLWMNCSYDVLKTLSDSNFDQGQLPFRPPQNRQIFACFEKNV